MRVILFTAALVVGGCQSGQVRFGGTIPVATHGEPSGTLVLTSAKAPPAPWLEPALAPARSCTPDVNQAAEESLVSLYTDDALSGRRVIAANVDFAIVQTLRMTVAVSRTQGILGSLTLPAGTRWVGLTDNHILAADAPGSLYCAPLSPPFDFRKQTTIAGVSHWDAGGNVIAALVDRRVQRSLDEGASFAEVSVEPKADIADVAVRFDGVMVVQGRHRSDGTPDAWVARGDRSLKRSTFPLSGLFRAGGIIGSRETCEPRLSIDGTTWISDALIPHRQEGVSDWPVAVLDSSEWRQTAQGEKSFVELPPAASQKTTLHRGIRCRSVFGGQWTLAPRVTMSRANPAKLHGTGAAAITGHVDPEAAPRNTTIQWFGDEVRDKRAATLGIVSRSPAALRVIQAPCDLARVFSVGGIGLIVCHKSTEGQVAPIMMIDRNGLAYQEGSLPLDGADPLIVSMASDGTLLLRHHWGEPQRQAFVRNPLALGSARAWRSVALRDAVEVRVTPSGGLLLIETGHVSVPASFALILDRPGERKELFRGIPVDGSLNDLFVTNGEIVALTKPFESDEAHGHRCQKLMNTGQLE